MASAEQADREESMITQLSRVSIIEDLYGNPYVLLEPHPYQPA